MDLRGPRTEKDKGMDELLDVALMHTGAQDFRSVCAPCTPNFTNTTPQFSLSSCIACIQVRLTDIACVQMIRDLESLGLLPCDLI